MLSLAGMTIALLAQVALAFIVYFCRSMTAGHRSGKVLMCSIEFAMLLLLFTLFGTHTQLRQG